LNLRSMKVYKSLEEPRRGFPRLVLGIGNFDGVHRGHVATINCVKRKAGPFGTPGILTFTPHPRTVTGKIRGEALTTLKQRLELFALLGIKVCWVIEFSRKFSRQAPGRFIQEVLFHRLRVEGICVGENYRFGRDRSGNVSLLEKTGNKFGFEVKGVKTARVRGKRVSSSLIRRLLRAGKLRETAQLLGRDYCLSGRVIRGARIGQQWGYPTANFYPEQLVPAAGVYAARIRVRDILRDGMVYIGRRPTLPGKDRSPCLAEAYLFGWRGSLYRRRIKVFLKKKIRGDIKFENLGDLYVRVRSDEKEAKIVLRGLPAVRINGE
jgi:riboflavin kinase/FMN adenylyltransferase